MANANHLGYNVCKKIKGGISMSIPNDELENLVEKLNDKNKQVAKSFLSWLLEEQLDHEDDELTPQDIEAIKQARKDSEAGNMYSLEEVKRELEI